MTSWPAARINYDCDRRARLAEETLRHGVNGTAVLNGRIPWKLYRAAIQALLRSRRRSCEARLYHELINALGLSRRSRALPNSEWLSRKLMHPSRCIRVLGDDTERARHNTASLMARIDSRTRIFLAISAAGACIFARARARAIIRCVCVCVPVQPVVAKFVKSV